MESRKKGVVLEASSSLESSKVSQESSDSGNMRVDHGVGSNSFSIWSEPFDLGKECPSICAELKKRAPFLQGSDRARYMKDFFTEIGGLCGEGIPFKRLKEDHGVSFESLLPMYPSNRSRNRHPWRHMSEPAVAEALRMYQRVYGGTQTDNCEFGTAFLRGLQLQAKKKQVNWAKGAAKLAAFRMKNAVNNPAKLTPPCLREQIQSMLDFMMGIVCHAIAANSAALSQLKEAQIPICPAALLTIDKGVCVGASKQHAKTITDQRIFVDVPIHTRALAKRPRSNNSKSNTVKGEKASTGSLLKRRSSTEDMLAKLLLQQKRVEDELALLQQQREDIEREEEGHWDSFAAIQQSKKEKDMDKLEREAVDTRLRVTMAAAFACTDALKANASEVNKWTKVGENFAHEVLKLQDLIVELTSQIHLVLIEESCIRPQQFFTSFPKEPLDMVPLRTELPCVLCGRYWAEMALVNLPCGCLFHPCCMFQIALCNTPKCLGCDHAPGGVWMGQWGFATNRPSMEANIAAFVAAMDGDGWAPPLGRVETLAKLKVLGVAAQDQHDWTVLKRVGLHNNSESKPKRVCLGPKASAFYDSGATVVHAVTEHGLVVGPPVLLDQESPTSNHHLDQHMSSENNTSVVINNPSSTLPCNNSLQELQFGSHINTEVVAIAHAAVAESLALNAVCE